MPALDPGGPDAPSPDGGAPEGGDLAAALADLTYVGTSAGAYGVQHSADLLAERLPARLKQMR